MHILSFIAATILVLLLHVSPILSITDEKREMIQERKETIKQEREEMTEEIKKQREEFKEKLKQIRSEKKQQLVERINENLNSVNDKRVGHFEEVLAKLRSLLSRFSTNTEQRKNEGKDTTAVNAAIASAEAALDTAEDAIVSQKDKEYIAEIKDEDTLRSTVGLTHKQLTADLQVVKKLLIDAKQAVFNVAKELRKLKTGATE